MVECTGIPLHSERTQCNVCNSTHPRIDIIANHISDIDNVLSTTNSLMDIFWQPDPSNPHPLGNRLQGLVARHAIEKDVGALCYTFAILLWIASDQNIRERKEDVRGISSRILGILNLEAGEEFVANATRTTHKQLFWAWEAFNWSRLKGVAGGDFVLKLCELRDLVNKGHTYFPRD